MFHYPLNKLFFKFRIDRMYAELGEKRRELEIQHLRISVFTRISFRAPVAVMLQCCILNVVLCTLPLKVFRSPVKQKK